MPKTLLDTDILSEYLKGMTGTSFAAPPTTHGSTAYSPSPV